MFLSLLKLKKMISINTIDYTIAGIRPYHFWAIIGITVALSVGMFLYKRAQVSVVYAIRSIIMSVPALLICAVVFGAIYSFIKETLLTGSVDLHSLLYGGIVFYGGLTGFVLSYLFIWRKKDEVSRKSAMDVCAVLIPLFHSFARLGCFFAGCCYGKSTSQAFGIEYTNMIDGASVTQVRIPTQLIESSFEAIVFLLMLFMFLQSINKGRLLWIYLTVYSVYRFFAEFLRGDWDRSVLPVLSFSQVYSILVLISIAVLIIHKRKGSALV